MRTIILVSSVALVVTVAVPPVARANGPCDTGHDLRYNPDRGTWIGYTWVYRIIRNSLPAAANTDRIKDKYIARIRDGIRMWNSGDTHCHRRFDRFYGFKTKIDPEHPYDGSSAAVQGDGTSTIDFAPNPCGKTTLDGCERGEVVRGDRRDVLAPQPRYRKIESDIRLDRESYHFTRRTTPCEDAQDLATLAGHEVGHTVGLGDTYQNVDDPEKNYPEVMAWGDRPDLECRFDHRKLGRADYLGLFRLYTFR